MDIFPEREECNDLFTLLEELLDCLEDAVIWPLLYIKFELLFIEKMGYGLDLSSCAVNGSTNDLSWVSPKSGRVVSSSAAKGWEDRLLKFPEFLNQKKITTFSKCDISDGCEYFLIKRVYSQHVKNLSSSRKRLLDYLNEDAFVI